MKKIVRFLLCSLVLILVGGVDVCKSVSFYDGEEIKTDSVLMINTDTDTIVFEKNSQKRRSMASLTKIMTYIITAEKVSDMISEKVEVKKEILDLLDKNSSVAGLRAGDVFSVFDLLHCLMVCSGNDAAWTLADYVGGGSVENFVEMMNQKADEIGCTDTHFVNPDGIYDENHYSNAWDMYKITRYAMKLPYFMEICGKREYKLFNDDRPILRTTNKMMNPGEKMYYCPYVKGIKTGWHSQAGRCLISFAQKGDISYVCVALGGSELDENGDEIDENVAMLDTKKLYTWAFDNLIFKNVIDKNNPIGQTGIKYAWRKDRLVLAPEANISLLLPKKTEISDIEISLNLPESVTAPVESGDIVGNAKLIYSGETLKEINVVSAETVPMSPVVFIIDNIKNIIFSRSFLIILILLGVLAYMFFASKSNKRKRTRRNIKNTGDSSHFITH